MSFLFKFCFKKIKVDEIQKVEKAVKIIERMVCQNEFDEVAQGKH